MNVTRLLTAAQVAAVAANGAPEFASVLPPRWHPWWHIGVSALQALAGWKQRSYTTDGSPQDVFVERAVKQAIDSGKDYGTR